MEPALYLVCHLITHLQNFLRRSLQLIFSCEEAALEGQMSVCVSVCLSDPKTEYYQGYAVWSVHKPIDCTRVHKTSLLYKCIQN